MNFIRESRAHELEVIKLNHEHELELQEYEQQSRVCQSCEALKIQLEVQNQLIRELTKKPVASISDETSAAHQAILPKHKPWSVRRNELERADRQRAEELKAQVTSENLDSVLEEVKHARKSS